MSDRAAELRQLVAALYDATGRGDWDAVAAMLTDDFVATEAPGLPFAGEWRGRDGLKRLYQTVIPMLNVQGFDIIETCAGGDHAVTLVDLLLPGDLGRARVAEMFRFRGHRCCEIRPYYFDPAPVWAAARANGFGGEAAA
jgi:ketosteroid isomerase-like protein